MSKWIKIDPINYEPCIYRLIDGNEVVYVGQTSCNVMARIRSHKKNKVFDRVEIMQARKPELDNIEAWHIVKYRPKYNKSLPYNPWYCTKKDICHCHEISNRSWNKLKMKPTIIFGASIYYEADEVLDRYSKTEEYKLYYE